VYSKSAIRGTTSPPQIEVPMVDFERMKTALVGNVLRGMIGWIVGPVVVAVVGGTQRVEVLLLTSLQLHVVAVESTVT